MIGSTSISVRWRELSCQLRHSQFLEFVILASEVGGGGQIEYRIPGNQSSAVLTGLKPNTTYTIVVAISNSNGTGPYSAPVNATTLVSTSGDSTPCALIPIFIIIFISCLPPNVWYRSHGYHYTSILICSWTVGPVSTNHCASGNRLCSQVEVGLCVLVSPTLINTCLYIGNTKMV